MSPTILFAEHDLVWAKAYEELMRQRGWRVIHLHHGERVVAVAEQERPDAIVMALALPRKDGLEILDEIQQSAEAKLIPVIIFSRIGTRDIIERCFASGACEYLIKQQHAPEEVLDAIERVVKKKTE